MKNDSSWLSVGGTAFGALSVVAGTISYVWKCRAKREVTKVTTEADVNAWLRERIDKLTAKIDDLEKAHDEKLAGLEAKYEECRTDRHALRVKAQSLQFQNNAQQREIDALSERVRNVANANAALSREVHGETNQ